ncbi:MAG: septation regulator SpoVG [Deltaproteobacteria bacterium]|nr:MAG: septation regulator SpoVG [Deltaproteobacteria bacterium]
MKITEIRIFPVNEDRLKAYVTITLDDCFVVRDLKVVRGNGGLFVAMPAKRRKDGTFKDIAHPLNTETRAWMESEILEAYHREVGSGSGEAVRSLGTAADAAGAATGEAAGLGSKGSESGVGKGTSSEGSAPGDGERMVARGNGD